MTLRNDERQQRLLSAAEVTITEPMGSIFVSFYHYDFHSNDMQIIFNVPITKHGAQTLST